MASILVGKTRVYKKGPLVKLVDVKNKVPGLLTELVILDIKRTKVGFSGLELMQRHFKNKRIQILT